MAEGSPTGRQGLSTGSSVPKASQKSCTPRAPGGYAQAFTGTQTLAPIAEISLMHTAAAVH
jgi:hypothetical protein